MRSTDLTQFPLWNLFMLLKNMILILYWLAHLETGLQPFVLFYSPKLPLFFHIRASFCCTWWLLEHIAQGAAGSALLKPCQPEAAVLHPCLHWNAAEVSWFMDGLAKPHIVSLGIGRFISLWRWVQHNSFISAFWWNNISLTERKNIFKWFFTGWAVAPGYSS